MGRTLCRRKAEEPVWQAWRASYYHRQANRWPSRDEYIQCNPESVITYRGIHVCWVLWRIEHVYHHCRNDSIVLASSWKRCDKHTVSLSYTHEKLFGLVRLNINPVHFNYGHIVLIELQPLRCHGSHIDNAEEVGLARRDWDRDILGFVEQNRFRNWLRATISILVVWWLIVVDETGCLIVV